MHGARQVPASGQEARPLNHSNPEEEHSPHADPENGQHSPDEGSRHDGTGQQKRKRVACPVQVVPELSPLGLGSRPTHSRGVQRLRRFAGTEACHEV